MSNSLVFFRPDLFLFFFHCVFQLRSMARSIRVYAILWSTVLANGLWGGLVVYRPGRGATWQRWLRDLAYRTVKARSPDPQAPRTFFCFLWLGNVDVWPSWRTLNTRTWRAFQAATELLRAIFGIVCKHSLRTCARCFPPCREKDGF